MFTGQRIFLASRCFCKVHVLKQDGKYCELKKTEHCGAIQKRSPHTLLKFESLLARLIIQDGDQQTASQRKNP